MSNTTPAADNGVAELVDCDNTQPEVLAHALRVVAQFGRTVLRRGYGNTGTLGGKWQESLVSLAFTPCLPHQFAVGKNTFDIASALDAMEASLSGRLNYLPRTCRTAGWDWGRWGSTPAGPTWSSRRKPTGFRYWPR